MNKRFSLSRGRNFVVLIAMFLMASTRADEPSVSNLSFTQDRTTQKVTVTYDLANDGEPAYVRLDVLTNGVSIGRHFIRSLKGDVSFAPGDVVTEGVGKTMVWNAHKDWPNCFSTETTVSVLAYSTNTPNAALPDIYLVVDLSAGTNTTSYPVRYTFTPPDPLQESSCARTELWLKRIAPGIYNMGRLANETVFSGGAPDVYETQHVVELTTPFFAGIFPVTFDQYNRVMGSTPWQVSWATCQAVCPIGNLGWNDLRGNGAVGSAYNWPISRDVDPERFFGRLRAKTGMIGFDLPTEAQWEYACRAGTTTAWNNGSAITNIDTDAELDKLGWYNKNSDGRLHPVGLKQPNAWGLYDMHGGVFEWCLDWFVARPDGGFDPITAKGCFFPYDPSSNMSRVQRGGSYTGEPWRCRSAYRRGRTTIYGDFGFRVFCTVE